MLNDTTLAPAPLSAAPRYAIYWTPQPSHPLWRAGCEWLGRDAANPSLHFEPRDATDEPRRYGFHATLKAPFSLRDGASAQHVLDGVRALAARTQCFAMPRLRVKPLGDFIALRPFERIAAGHALRRLADACVRELEPLRAPLSEAELRRRAVGSSLSPEQQQLLGRWGYPHVFEHWRFHMSLSNVLAHDASGAALRQRLMVEAERLFAPALGEALSCASISIFIEPARGGPLVLAHRIALAA